VGAWFAMLVIAVIGGVVREKVLAARIGDLRASQLETVAVGAIFAALITAFVWWAHVAPRDAMVLGVGWYTATIGFETFMGRVLLKQPWSVVLANYNLARGRLWSVVLAVILVWPAVASYWRHN